MIFIFIFFFFFLFFYLFIYLFTYLFNSSLKNYVNIIIILEYLLVLLYIIFININIKQRIIKDEGYFKILLFSIGFIIYNTCNFFMTNTNFNECSYNFIFKHIGISLILFTYSLYIIPGVILGIVSKEDEKLKFIINEISSNNQLSSSSYDVMNKRNTLNKSTNSTNINIDNNTKEKGELNQNHKLNLNDTIDANDKKISHINLNYISDTKDKRISLISNNDKRISRINSKKQDTNSSIISCIRQVHSLLIEIYIVYVVYFISIFIIFIYHLLNQNNNKSNDYYIVKNNNGDWIYKCNLEEMNFFINCFHLIVMILLLINGRKLLKYQGVFKCTKYIIYSLYIGIAFGPIVNVIFIKFYN